jgi:hypothetical protein
VKKQRDRIWEAYTGNGKCSCVPDCFDTYPDTDPKRQIRTTRLRIRILLCSSPPFKMPTKNKFLFSSIFAYYRRYTFFTSVVEVTKL